MFRWIIYEPLYRCCFPCFGRRKWTWFHHLPGPSILPEGQFHGPPNRLDQKSTGGLGRKPLVCDGGQNQNRQLAKDTFVVPRNDFRFEGGPTPSEHIIFRVAPIVGHNKRDWLTRKPTECPRFCLDQEDGQPAVLLWELIRIPLGLLPDQNCSGKVCLHRKNVASIGEKSPCLTRSPRMVPFLTPFLGEGSPTKIDYRKKLVPLFQPLYWRT